MTKRRDVFLTSVDGGAEIGALLDELPKSLSDNVIKATAKKALKPVAEMAISMVPSRDPGGAHIGPDGSVTILKAGGLKGSIIISTKLSSRQKKLFGKKGDVVVYAGPSYPAGAAGHLVEFGTGPRYQRSTGKYVGVMPAHPFMRPAWDSQKESVLETMRTEIWGVLVKAVRRLRKRAEGGKLSKSQTNFFAGK